MQKDFHFYCIAVLARAAGFDRRSALTIAYASQYVDDSTEGDPIHIQVGDTNFTIDPVRTSYNVLKPNQGLESLGWGAQKRVHIPFHFLPPKRFRANQPDLPFSYVTEAHSSFSELLLDAAAAETHPIRRLCRIGIALHTYADTWAHHGFSGRKGAENDVEQMQLKDPTTKRWKNLFIENLIDDIPLLNIPEIGHAEALFFPDVPYLEWKCVIGPDQTPHYSYNALSFLEAAQLIYRRLHRMVFSHVTLNSDPSTNAKKGRKVSTSNRHGSVRQDSSGEMQTDLIPWRGGTIDVVPWEELSPLIQERLVTWPKITPGMFGKIGELRDMINPDERCQSWEKVFADWFEPLPGAFPDRYHYDIKAYRESALVGDTDWDNRSRAEWQQQAAYQSAAPSLPDFWNTPWAQFHRAALLQRHRVLERIP
jgi:hypothetical protein